MNQKAHPVFRKMWVFHLSGLLAGIIIIVCCFQKTLCQCLPVENWLIVLAESSILYQKYGANISAVVSLLILLTNNDRLPLSCAVFIANLLRFASPAKDALCHFLPRFLQPWRTYDLNSSWLCNLASDHFQWLRSCFLAAEHPLETLINPAVCDCLPLDGARQPKDLRTGQAREDLLKCMSFITSYWGFFMCWLKPRRAGLLLNETVNCISNEASFSKAMCMAGL